VREKNVRGAYRVLAQVANDLTTTDPADRFILAIEPPRHISPQWDAALAGVTEWRLSQAQLLFPAGSSTSTATETGIKLPHFRQPPHQSRWTSTTSQSRSANVECSSKPMNWQRMTNNAHRPARAEFTRREMIDGLRDLVHRLRSTGQPSRIQIVGGAAIALALALALNEHRSGPLISTGP